MSTELTKIIAIILTSTLLTGIITSLFSKFSKDKDNKLQYITKERQKWRNELREATLELRKLYEFLNNNFGDKSNLKFSSYNEVKVYFQIRLNPNDQEDSKILGLFNKIDTNNLQLIEEGIAQLLKYEWQKAKLEAGLIKEKIQRKPLILEDKK